MSNDLRWYEEAMLNEGGETLKKYKFTRYTVDMPEFIEEYGVNYIKARKVKR